MDKKIMVVGAGMMGKTALVRSIMANENIEVVSADEAQKNTVSTPEPPSIPFTNTRLHQIGDNFICKGKHRYLPVDDNWICQCGRKL